VFSLNTHEGVGEKFDLLTTVDIRRDLNDITSNRSLALHVSVIFGTEESRVLTPVA